MYDFRVKATVPARVMNSKVKFRNLPYWAYLIQRRLPMGEFIDKTGGKILYSREQRCFEYDDINQWHAKGATPVEVLFTVRFTRCKDAAMFKLLFFDNILKEE